MPSLPEHERLKGCAGRAAKGRKVVAICAYGSRVAGYSRPDSDVDLLVVLERYPYAVKYAYLQESGADVSALVVDRRALEMDAKSAYLGEFVAGRLLHVYEPVENAEFLEGVERVYKRRVILEEMQDVVRAAGVLASEISFPLEYVAFARIKRRAALYPAAAYSYFKTYTANERNLQFAMQGYRRALADIVEQDPELFATEGGTLRLSEKSLHVARGEPALRLTKKLRELGSYLVHSYAGRKTYHLAVREARSKIRRHMRQPVELPPFMSCPACTYWKLPEGLLVADSRRQDWLDDVAKQNNIAGYATRVRRLGNQNSRTMLYSLMHRNGELRIAVKKLARTKSVKWAALSVWTAPVKKFRIGPLFRLGTEYKAIRHLRTMGLRTPAIQAVVLDRKLLVTQFVDGKNLADVIRGALAGGDDTALIRTAGEQIARVHAAGAAFGNIKPKNVIVNGDLYFTDLEQFVFTGGDPAWDVAQFLCWGLKGTRRAEAASRIAREFLGGYGNAGVIKRLAGSRRYVESFYPVLAPQVAQSIKKELKNY